MSKYKMEWCLFNKEKKLEKCNIDNIDKEEYDIKYKNYLTCINGCKARIKFTRKKNGSKFFSTWNGEGKIHNEDCQYHSNYIGARGRKKLLEEYEKRQISDDKIEASIKRKINALKKVYTEEDNGGKKQGTNTVIPTGEITVKVGIDGKIDEEGRISKGQYIGSVEASLIDKSYDKLYKSVYGIIENVQHKYSDNGELYGYLNLNNNRYKVSIYFPPAYYEGNELNRQKLEKALEVLEDEVNNKKKKSIVICYGQIKPKKGNKNEYNIHVINPRHILINEMSIEKIYLYKMLNEIDYDIL